MIWDGEVAARLEEVKHVTQALLLPGKVSPPSAIVLGFAPELPNKHVASCSYVPED